VEKRVSLFSELSFPAELAGGTVFFTGLCAHQDGVGSLLSIQLQTALFPWSVARAPVSKIATARQSASRESREAQRPREQKCKRTRLSLPLDSVCFCYCHNQIHTWWAHKGFRSSLRRAKLEDKQSGETKISHPPRWLLRSDNFVARSLALTSLTQPWQQLTLPPRRNSGISLFSVRSVRILLSSWKISSERANEDKRSFSTSKTSFSLS
jgi:hypothetical protein